LSAKNIATSLIGGLLGGAIVITGAWALVAGPTDLPAQAVRTGGEPTVIAAPEGAPAAAVGATDREAIEKIVREYLLANPEILRDMAGALQAKEQVAQREQLKGAFAGLKPKIFSSPLQMTIGNPEGDVTLVEFFDYNCGYCKRALPDLDKLIKEDPKLKVVLKEFPVLGEESLQASRVAIAVYRKAPERYEEFHHKLLASEGTVNGETALKLAETYGLKADELIADANSKETEAFIRESHELAQALGINGTPSWVVGEDMLPGAIGADALKEAVENVRSCGKASCS
jgi:protein-disulfide isomerase